jgi:hypothetical protein
MWELCIITSFWHGYIGEIGLVHLVHFIFIEDKCSLQQENRSILKYITYNAKGCFWYRKWMHCCFLLDRTRVWNTYSTNWICKLNLHCTLQLLFVWMHISIMLSIWYLHFSSTQNKKLNNSHCFTQRESENSLHKLQLMGSHIQDKTKIWIIDRIMQKFQEG